MRKIDHIPVTDSEGRVIGEAELKPSPEGYDVQIELNTDFGVALVRSIQDGFVDALSLKPVVPMAREASIEDY